MALGQCMSSILLYTVTKTDTAVDLSAVFSYMIGIAPPIRDASKGSFLGEMLLTRFIITCISMFDPVFLFEVGLSPHGNMWSLRRHFLAALFHPVPLVVRSIRTFGFSFSRGPLEARDRRRSRGHFSLHVEERDEPVWASTIFLVSWLALHSVIGFISAYLALCTLRWAGRGQEDRLIGFLVVWNSVSALLLLLGSARWYIIAPIISRRCWQSQARANEKRDEQKCFMRGGSESKEDACV